MEIKYELNTCDSCATEDIPCVLTQHNWRDERGEQDIFLCEICYTTHLSKGFFYPTIQTDNNTLAIAIAQAINILRKETKPTTLPIT